MKRIYSYQLEHLDKTTIILDNDHEEVEDEPKWISVKNF